MIIYDTVGFSNSFSVIGNYFKLSRSIVDRKKYESIHKVTESLFLNLTKLLDRPSKNVSVSDVESFLQYSSTFRDKLFDLVSLIENKKITPKQRDIFLDVYKNECDKFDLANLDWLEPVRRARNRVLHDSEKPKIEQSMFNYFQLLENEESEYPYIQFYNNQSDLVCFDHYLVHIIFCFSYVFRLIAKKLKTESNEIAIDMISHSKYCDIINSLNYHNSSEEEIEKRKLFSILDFNKSSLKKICNAHSQGEFSSVGGFYMAGIYLKLGVILAKENNYKEAETYFSHALELNFNMSQLSNIIGCQVANTSHENNEHIINLIKKHMFNAYRDNCLIFFTNSGLFLSDIPDNEFASYIYELGISFINDNKCSVDFMYNYAHFLKNNLKEYDKALDYCFKIIDIDPVDQSAHKMTLNIFLLKHQKTPSNSVLIELYDYILKNKNKISDKDLLTMFENVENVCNKEINTML